MYHFNKTFVVSVLLFACSFMSLAQFKREQSQNIFRAGIRHVEVVSPDAQLLGKQFAPVFDLGFGRSYQLSKNIAFEPEIHYNPRGVRTYTQFTDSTNASASVFLHYLDFSPNFSLTLGKGYGRSIPLHIWAGPYVGYAIAGSGNADLKTINTRTSRADTTISTSISPFDQGFSRLDYGINVGIGLQFEKFVSVGITYSRGFNNIADKRIYGSTALYNQSLGIYVSVLFDDIF